LNGAGQRARPCIDRKRTIFSIEWLDWKSTSNVKCCQYTVYKIPENSLLRSLMIVQSIYQLCSYGKKALNYSVSLKKQLGRFIETEWIYSNFFLIGYFGTRGVSRWLDWGRRLKILKFFSACWWRLENSKMKNSFENKKIPVYFNIWVLICSKTIEKNCHIPEL